MSARSNGRSPLGKAKSRQPDMYGMPGHLIRRMHQASQAIFDAEVNAAGFDLTPVQFAALTMIDAIPGLDQASLATAISFDRATTGGVIDRLEAKGLVRREIDQTDRRMRRLHLELAGKAVLSVATPIVKRVQKVMLRGLTAKEQEVLLLLLHKALDSVGAASGGVARSEMQR